MSELKINIKYSPKNEYSTNSFLFIWIKYFFGYTLTKNLISKFNKIYTFLNFITTHFHIFLTNYFFSSTSDIKKKFKYISKNTNQLNLNKDEKIYLENLKTNGYVILNEYFDKTDIDNLNRKLENNFKNFSNVQTENYESELFPGNVFLNYQEVRNNFSNMMQNNLYNSFPQILDFSLNNSIMKIVCNYLEAIPYVGETNAIRSFAPINDKRLKEASYWHKDTVGLKKYLQIFIYLHDVNENNGPFCFLKGSHGQIYKSFKVLYEHEKGSVLSYGRITDEEIDKYFTPDKKILCTAPKGSVIIADTSGFHRGPTWNVNDIKSFTERNILNLTISYGNRSNRDKNINTTNYNVKSEEELNKLTDLQKTFVKVKN